MHDEEIKRIILEVYFLFKKIIALTTSLAISLLSINGIYAQASVLNNINSEAVNASYLEKKDLNTNIYDFNNHIYAVNINNIDNSINIADNDKNNYLICEGIIDKLSEISIDIGMWVDYESITNEYMNSGFVGTIKVYIESK